MRARRVTGIPPLTLRVPTLSGGVSCSCCLSGQSSSSVLTARHRQGFLPEDDLDNHHLISQVVQLAAAAPSRCCPLLAVRCLLPVVMCCAQLCLAASPRRRPHHSRAQAAALEKYDTHATIGSKSLQVLPRPAAAEGALRVRA